MLKENLIFVFAEDHNVYLCIKMQNCIFFLKINSDPKHKKNQFDFFSVNYGGTSDAYILHYNFVFSIVMKPM